MIKSKLFWDIALIIFSLLLFIYRFVYDNLMYLEIKQGKFKELYPRSMVRGNEVLVFTYRIFMHVFNSLTTIFSFIV